MTGQSEAGRSWGPAESKARNNCRCDWRLTKWLWCWLWNCNKLCEVSVLLRVVSIQILPPFHLLTLKLRGSSHTLFNNPIQSLFLQSSKRDRLEGWIPHHERQNKHCQALLMLACRAPGEQAFCLAFRIKARVDFAKRFQKREGLHIFLWESKGLNVDARPRMRVAKCHTWKALEAWLLK